jgi:hypothetical protein
MQDAGAMRFPDTPFMRRVFNLVRDNPNEGTTRKVDVKLIKYTFEDKKTFVFFNNNRYTRSQTLPEDPFRVRPWAPNGKLSWRTSSRPQNSTRSGAGSCTSPYTSSQSTTTRCCRTPQPGSTAACQRPSWSRSLSIGLRTRTIRRPTPSSTGGASSTCRLSMAQCAR